MFKFGFIGFGNAGSRLVRGLLRTGALYPSDIILSSRTIEKVIGLEKEFPGLEIAASNLLAAEKAERLVLCVDTPDLEDLLEELRPALKPHRVVITLAEHLRLSSLEAQMPNPVFKLRLGDTIGTSPFSKLTSGLRSTQREKAYLEKVLGHLGPLRHHDEEY